MHFPHSLHHTPSKVSPGQETPLHRTLGHFASLSVTAQVTVGATGLQLSPTSCDVPVSPGSTAVASNVYYKQTAAVIDDAAASFDGYQNRSSTKVVNFAGALT